CICAFRTR
ncbi:peroxidase family protein, partial [Vibrio parahaemolyticus VPTS-2010]